MARFLAPFCHLSTRLLHPLPSILFFVSPTRPCILNPTIDDDSAYSERKGIVTLDVGVEKYLNR